jgi:hypothetical protein
LIRNIINSFVCIVKDHTFIELGKCPFTGNQYDTIKVMRLTTTHKANLFDKDPLYYAKFGYAKHSLYNHPCCNTCKYYWVTHEER